MSFVRKDFRSANFNKLAELFGQFMPDRYAISGPLLSQMTVSSPVFDWGASHALYTTDNELVAFAAVKRSAARLYSGPEPDTAHLTMVAFSNPDAGVDCMAFVKSVLRNRGVTKLVFGQDTRHFFPGCPVDASQLQLFLTVEGFEEGSEQVDLERDLQHYKAVRPVPEGAVFRMLTEDDRASMMEFFDRTFPGRWRHDVVEKVSVEGISKSVFGLLVDGQVQGFALLQDWTCSQPIGGAVWNMALGPNWGSLGPIGVAANLRGQKLGGALLDQALCELQHRGVHRCSIDWTGLIDFYGKFGFEVSRTYRTMSLKLD